MRLKFALASLLLAAGCAGTYSSGADSTLSVDAIIDPCGEILKCKSVSVQKGTVYCGDALKIIVSQGKNDKDSDLTSYIYVLEGEASDYYLNNNCMTGIWHSVQFNPLSYVDSGFCLEVAEVPDLGRTLVCNVRERQEKLVKIPVNNGLIDGEGMRVGSFRPVFCPAIYKRLPQTVKGISRVGGGKKSDIFIAALYVDDSGKYALLCSRYTMAGDLKCSCNILGAMGFAPKRVDHYDWKTTDSTIVETCVSEAYEDSCVGFGLRLSIVFNDVVKRYFIPINAKGWNRDLLGGF